MTGMSPAVDKRVLWKIIERWYEEHGFTEAAENIKEIKTYRHSDPEQLLGTLVSFHNRHFVGK